MSHNCKLSEDSRWIQKAGTVMGACYLPGYQGPDSILRQKNRAEHEEANFVKHALSLRYGTR